MQPGEIHNLLNLLSADSKTFDHRYRALIGIRNFALCPTVLAASLRCAGSASEFNKLFPRPETFGVCSTLCILVRDGLLEPVQAATTLIKTLAPPSQASPTLPTPLHLRPNPSPLNPGPPWQRLVAFYVLYDVYKSEAAPANSKSSELGAANPFLPIFLDTLRNKTFTDECERGFLISLLCTPPRDLPKVLLSKPSIDPKRKNKRRGEKTLPLTPWLCLRGVSLAALP